MRYPEECGGTYEEEKAWIEKANADPRGVVLVCLVEGTIAGTCRLSFGKRLKTRHRAGAAIGLTRAYWGQGIGTRMFQEMIRLAQADPAVRDDLTRPLTPKGLADRRQAAAGQRISPPLPSGSGRTSSTSSPAGSAFRRCGTGTGPPWNRFWRTTGARPWPWAATAPP